MLAHEQTACSNPTQLHLTACFDHLLCSLAIVTARLAKYLSDQLNDREQDENLQRTQRMSLEVGHRDGVYGVHTRARGARLTDKQDAKMRKYNKSLPYHGNIEPPAIRDYPDFEIEMARRAGSNWLQRMMQVNGLTKRWLDINLIWLDSTHACGHMQPRALLSSTCILPTKTAPQAIQES